jgi:hypothetical protein
MRKQAVSPARGRARHSLNRCIACAAEIFAACTAIQSSLHAAPGFCARGCVAQVFCGRDFAARDNPYVLASAQDAAAEQRISSKGSFPPAAGLPQRSAIATHLPVNVIMEGREGAGRQQCPGCRLAAAIAVGDAVKWASKPSDNRRAESGSGSDCDRSRFMILGRLPLAPTPCSNHRLRQSEPG